ncbi:MAG: CHAP domain-containing protein [Heliobacteriaceae bacterium]|jgi:uncharacterized protein YkvS|nr:CHAP domain-containing protein [Heliobacteriaceae bacterium]
MAPIVPIDFNSYNFDRNASFWPPVDSLPPVFNFPPPVNNFMSFWPTPVFDYSSFLLTLPMPDFLTTIPKFDFNFDFNFSSAKSSLSTNTSINTSQTTFTKGFGNVSLGKAIANTAGSYLGYSEANGKYKLFTGGRDMQWCAAFTTYAAKEAFRAQGKAIPAGFGSDTVEGLRQWGIKNNKYLKLTGSSNKKELVLASVKPGDIIIFKEGTSHTGIVTSVDKNGVISTVEGNSSDAVNKRRYTADWHAISGFVQVA